MPIDDSELRQLVHHIDGAPRRAMKAAEASAKRGMQNMKNDMVKDAQSSNFRQIAPTISYDERHTRRGIEYELGPDKDERVSPSRARRFRWGNPNRSGKPGALANIAYFGGANGGGGSLDFDEPIEKELPKLEKHLREALGDAL